MNSAMKEKAMKVAASHLAEEIAIPTVSYKSCGLIELSSTKYVHLVKMYDNFMSAVRRPAMLTL